MNPKYPVYVISKGRADSRLTIKALERIKVPYHVVIEPQEFDDYAKHVDREKILTLPFSNLGKGSIPARNWVWDHAIDGGHKRHWIMDDNIRDFYRLNKNTKSYVGDGTIFRCAEDFVDRYANVPMAGFNYHGLVNSRDGNKKPFTINTRIYSCILLTNATLLRWRGRYNEDTDLSIRFLKQGQCTILFNAFLAEKKATMRMKGGNTDELYKQDQGFDGRLEMARSLLMQHPDIVEIKWKWNRWQHHVDYSRFKANKLQLVTSHDIPDGVDDYGMVLKEEK